MPQSLVEVSIDMGQKSQAWDTSHRHGTQVTDRGQNPQTGDKSHRHRTKVTDVGQNPQAWEKKLQTWDKSCKHGTKPTDKGQKLQTWDKTHRHWTKVTDMGQKSQTGDKTHSENDTKHHSLLPLPTFTGDERNLEPLQQSLQLFPDLRRPLQALVVQEVIITPPRVLPILKDQQPLKRCEPQKYGVDRWAVMDG